MTTVWGVLTIGATPVRISTTALPVCKLAFQVAPSATGSVKIGATGLTTDNTTGGSYLWPTANTAPDGSALAGSMWAIEDQGNRNTIDASAYFVHGTHAGDKVHYQYNVN